MKSIVEKKVPEIIFRDGEPAAVILDINEYRELLERLEDVEDLKELEKMREKVLKYRKLDDFLQEHDPGV